MPLDEDLTQLRQANAVLQAEVTRLQSIVTSLEAQLADLRQQKSPPPFVKPNQPVPPVPRPRKKRDAAHNHGRPRATPTEVRIQAYDTCPTCAYPLTGTSIARRREVLELPPPPPVTVIEFQVLKRYWPCCAKWVEPTLDLDGLVVGHGRLSVGIMARVAWLRTVFRLPIRQIQIYLTTMHGFAVSIGELCVLLATVADAGAETAASIKTELRASAALHMDETGWREAGQNGYAWVMTNAAGMSYFHYDRSRAGAVARSLSGAHYAGTLCTDFYAGYNAHSGRHQRCWAQLLRDLAELEKRHGTDAEIAQWITGVCVLYQEGAGLGGRVVPPSTAERTAKADELRRRVHALGLCWAQASGHPAHALCQRLLRHEAELFEFVRQVAVEATNNRAERAIRPLAVVRKISGGTRSPTGSRTRMRLQTLFTTWAATGRDPLQACLAMLRAQTLLPSL